MSSSCTRGGSGWTLGKISSSKSGEILEQAAQGGGRIAVPGGIQEIDVALKGMALRGHGLWAWW